MILTRRTSKILRYQFQTLKIFNESRHLFSWSAEQTKFVSEGWERTNVFHLQIDIQKTLYKQHQKFRDFVFEEKWSLKFFLYKNKPRNTKGAFVLGHYRALDMFTIVLSLILFVMPSSCLRCYTCSTTTYDRFKKVQQLIFAKTTPPIH